MYAYKNFVVMKNNRFNIVGSWRNTITSDDFSTSGKIVFHLIYNLTYDEHLKINLRWNWFSWWNINEDDYFIFSWPNKLSQNIWIVLFNSFIKMLNDFLSFPLNLCNEMIAFVIFRKNWHVIVMLIWYGKINLTVEKIYNSCLKWRWIFYMNTCLHILYS